MTVNSLKCPLLFVSPWLYALIDLSFFFFVDCHISFVQLHTLFGWVYTYYDFGFHEAKLVLFVRVMIVISFLASIIVVL